MMFSSFLMGHTLVCAVVFGIFAFMSLCNYPLLRDLEGGELGSLFKRHGLRVEKLLWPLIGIEIFSGGFVVLGVNRSELLIYLQANMILLALGLVFLRLCAKQVTHLQHSNFDKKHLRTFIKLHHFRSLIWGLRLLLLFWVFLNFTVLLF